MGDQSDGAGMTGDNDVIAMTSDNDVIATIRCYWDVRSASFDGHIPSTGDAEAWLAIYLRALRALFPGRSGSFDILDVGVGTGYIAIPLAKTGHRVTGVDISPGMLAQAERNAAARGARIRLINGGAHPLPEVGGAFDLVTCRNLLWTLPDPAAALSGWLSVLRPHGAVLVSDAMWNAQLDGVSGPGNPRSAPDNSTSNGVYGRFLHAYLPLRPHLPYYRGLTPEDAERLLRKVGLRDPQRFDSPPEASTHHCPPDGFFVMGARLPG